MAGDQTATADRLYGLPPRRFVAERDAAVAAARADGDTETAAALAKLRRPSVAAWLVNLLALRRPELVAELADLAGALQAAQRELDGAQLRELTGQRRATVSALVATARSLALEADPELTHAKLPLAEVESTLSAALTDRQAAEAVRSGRLTGAVTAEGFGELPPARLRLVTGGAGGDDPDQPAGRQGAARTVQAQTEQARAELSEARAAAGAANAELDRATAAQQRAKQRLAEIEAELAELAERRTAAAEQLARAESAALDARRAAVAARRRAGAAEAAVAALGGEDAG